MDQIAEQFKAQWICYGENVDDTFDYRPGSPAAKEHQIRSPLIEADFQKEDIRNLAREIGLLIWDKPSGACLAIRFLYGVEITPHKLAQVEGAENILADLGFHLVRVRHHGEVARIEIDQNLMAKLVGQAERIERDLKKIGFKYITLDLVGYRRGIFDESERIYVREIVIC